MQYKIFVVALKAWQRNSGRRYLRDVKIIQNTTVHVLKYDAIICIFSHIRKAQVSRIHSDYVCFWYYEIKNKEMNYGRTKLIVQKVVRY